MHQGKVNGYFCQGFNPLLSTPNRGEARSEALSKLTFLVTMDPLDTETSHISGRTTANTTTWTRSRHPARR